jgi:hypothetical protein
MLAESDSRSSHKVARQQPLAVILNWRAPGGGK